MECVVEGANKAQEKALRELFERRKLFVHPNKPETHTADNVLTHAGWSFAHQTDCLGNVRCWWIDGKGDQYFMDSEDIVLREMRTDCPFTLQPYNQWRVLRFSEFRALAYTDRQGVVMVPWLGMYIGIDHDGHTHS